MNKPWKRKPRTNPPNWKDYRIEDLFECHTCKEYQPWMSFRKGRKFLFEGDDNDDDVTYKLMDDIEDRGGRQWSCDECINKILYNNKIITVRNKDGKLITLDTK